MFPSAKLARDRCNPVAKVRKWMVWSDNQDSYQPQIVARRTVRSVGRVPCARLYRYWRARPACHAGERMQWKANRMKRHIMLAETRHRRKSHHKGLHAVGSAYLMPVATSLVLMSATSGSGSVVMPSDVRQLHKLCGMAVVAMHKRYPCTQHNDDGREHYRYRYGSNPFHFHESKVTDISVYFLPDMPKFMFF